MFDSVTLALIEHMHRPSIIGQSAHCTYITVIFEFDEKVTGRHLLLEPLFLDNSAVYGRIFIKPTAFFFVNYHSDAMFIVVFPPPTKVVMKLKRPLSHY